MSIITLSGIPDFKAELYKESSISTDANLSRTSGCLDAVSIEKRPLLKFALIPFNPSEVRNIFSGT